MLIVDNELEFTRPRLISTEDIKDFPYVSAFSEADEKRCHTDCVIRRVLDDGSQYVNSVFEHVNLFLHRFRTERREMLGHAPCRFARTFDTEVREHLVAASACPIKPGHQG